MNNTGKCNTGDYNTGTYNTGDYNTGYRNTGNHNTGDYSTGDCNTGDYSTGDFNTGYKNTGDFNTGNYNTGDYNTGNHNIGDYNTGYFNTITPDEILVFNKKCKREDWNKCCKPYFMYFNLTKWIDEKDMTKKEKEENPTYKTTRGYLKVYEYKEAFRKSYYNLSEEEKTKQTKQLKALPNFDKDIFFEISGIDIDEKIKKKMTLKEIEKELGYEIEIIEENND